MEKKGWDVKLRMLLFAPILLLMIGCSSFSKDWRATLKQPLPADLSGPWEGQWTSDVNGHNGRLRCIMTRKAEGEYDARFHANYKKILSFSYTVPMKVRRMENSWQFEGEADLGKMAGGLYSYKGAASSTNFFSTYDNKYDHGKFEMSRPAK
jgi:hypothetical protein